MNNESGAAPSESPVGLASSQSIGEPTAAQMPPKTKALRKKRNDTLRTGGKRSSAAGKQSQQQSLQRRLARARWAVMMLIPPLLILLHRIDRVEHETSGHVTALVLSGAFLMLSIVAAVNEIFGTSHVPAYLVTLCFSVIWGSLILAIKDLIAVRLMSMVWFGVCAGSLRYHWADDHEDAAVGNAGRKRQNVSVGAEMQSSSIPQDFGYSSGSTSVPSNSTQQPLAASNGETPLSVPAGYSSPSSPYDSTANRRVPLVAFHGVPPTEGAVPPPMAPKDSSSAPVQDDSAMNAVNLQRVVQRGGDLLVATGVWRKVGLGLCATLGEVIGCAMFVPNSWTEVITVSWLGYAAVILVPIVAYKSASWLSHFLVLICGSRVNTADASRLLFLYWITTTVLSLGALFFTVAWLLASLVPYVWGLQLLVTPYSVIFELIAYESKECQATNPYKEVAELYREHISTTMKNSKEYFVH